MTQADYPALAAILQDGQTMVAYEGALNDEETQNWLSRQLERYEKDGFGLWAVILKEDVDGLEAGGGGMIGQCGLSWQDVDGERVPEVGYLFNRAYWHRGYAIEAARACKEYGFEKLGFDEIFTIVRDINLPSMNVAIRNGMVIRKRTVRHFKGVGMLHYVFSARRGEYK
ncbi:MAG: GNAT family N-acetyltransferase [Firmicutes bacterium]|nr:GNAT family N-acetyltransferase [Bacillota bacterium]